MSNAPVLTFNDSKPHLPGESSMWFFIVGDLLIFGVYFVVYMYYRAQEPALFLQNQQYLSQEIGVINTVILLTSSLFVALSTEAARKNNNSEAFKLMGIALLFGLIFPCLKIIEWIPKISSGMTPGENLFFMFYYLMTGLHLCHVILGLIILMFVMREFRPSHQANVTFVETGSTYWHMVDLLWLVLYALLYLMR